MTYEKSLSSTDSENFYVEQLSGERSPRRNNTSEIHTSTELSGAYAREAITISTMASPVPKKMATNSDLNKPTISYSYGKQDSTIPANSKDLIVPPNLVNIPATKAVVEPRVRQCDERECPRTSVQSELSTISTPPMKVSAV